MSPSSTSTITWLGRIGDHLLRELMVVMHHHYQWWCSLMRLDQQQVQSDQVILVSDAVLELLVTLGSSELHTTTVYQK